MTNPLHASYYADSAAQHQVQITENEEIAQDSWRVRFQCPRLAQQAVPGQFVMVRVADCDDPLIGRPLAVFDVLCNDAGHGQAIDLVYLVKGKFTQALHRLPPGSYLDVWGPLGNGFPVEPTSRLILVVGGIGQTPMLAVAKEYLGQQSFGSPARSEGRICDQVILCYGARNERLLAGIDEFEAAGMDVRIATDDGSRGHHGLVTDLLQEELNRSQDNCRIFCCGPEPMMEAVSNIAEQTNVPCHVSLETPMACGVGICFTCVAKIRDEDGWDYKRTCVEGPVFDCEKIIW